MVETKYLTLLDQLKDLDEALYSLSPNEQADAISDLAWASRDFSRAKDSANNRNVDHVITRLLDLVPEALFHSPELQNAAIELQKYIQAYFVNHPQDMPGWTDPNIERIFRNGHRLIRIQKDYKDPVRWPALPIESRVAFLQSLHNRQAELLGFTPATVSYRVGCDVHNNFVDGEIPYGKEETPYAKIYINSRTHNQVRYGFKEDVETVLMLGLRKFHLTALMQPNLFKGVSPAQSRLIKLCSAQIAWYYQVKTMDDYAVALKLPHNVVARNFINACFGGEHPLFPVYPYEAEIRTDSSASGHYCSIGTAAGRLRYFRSVFDGAGMPAYHALKDGEKRNAMIDMFADTQDEIATRADKQQYEDERWPQFQISRLFKATAFYPEFVQYYRDGRRNFVTILKSSLRVQFAKQLWPILPNWIRRRELHHIASLQDKAFTLPELRYGGYTSIKYGPLQSCTEGQITNGCFDGYQISINTTIQEKWRSFPWALRVLIHEKTHQQQKTFALRATKFLQSSQMRRQAQQFEDFFFAPRDTVFDFSRSCIYVQPEDDYAAYRNHPIERHARSIAEIVSQSIGEGYIEKKLRQHRKNRQATLAPQSGHRMIL